MKVLDLVGFPSGTHGKEPFCQCRRHKRLGFNPWAGKIPGEGNGNPLQDSCLENPMDRGAWWPTVHRVQSLTQLKQFSRHTLVLALEFIDRWYILVRSFGIPPLNP